MLDRDLSGHPPLCADRAGSPSPVPVPDREPSLIRPIAAIARFAGLAGAAWLATPQAPASDAQIQLPDLHAVSFPLPGGATLSGLAILYSGIAVCALGILFGLWQYFQTRRLPVHPCMADVSDTIWETCKTYLLQQGRFLIGLWGLIALCIAY